MIFWMKTLVTLKKGLKYWLKNPQFYEVIFIKLFVHIINL
jgi:hypothetical protein